VSKARFWKQM